MTEQMEGVTKLSQCIFLPQALIKQLFMKVRGRGLIPTQLLTSRTMDFAEWTRKLKDIFEGLLGEYYLNQDLL